MLVHQDLKSRQSLPAAHVPLELALQHDQLTPERGILRLKSAVRLDGEPNGARKEHVFGNMAELGCRFPRLNRKEPFDCCE